MDYSIYIHVGITTGAAPAVRKSAKTEAHVALPRMGECAYISLGQMAHEVTFGVPLRRDVETISYSQLIHPPRQCNLRAFRHLSAYMATSLPDANVIRCIAQNLSHVGLSRNVGLKKQFAL